MAKQKWPPAKKPDGTWRKKGGDSTPDSGRGYRPNIPKIDPNSVKRPTGSAVKPPPTK